MKSTMYCTEACTAIIDLLFSEGVSVNGTIYKAEAVYATVTTDNEAAVGVLKKLRFIGYRPKKKDEPIIVGNAVIGDDGKAVFNLISRFILEKEALILKKARIVYLGLS